MQLSAPVLASITALGKVLLKVLLAQAIGYTMKRSKLIPDTAISGIGSFAGLVSLPALLFKAVATLDFGTVDINVVVALTFGKLLLVALSAALGQIVANGEAGSAEYTGACFGLLTTNSDDLGLGLPVLGAIFPKELVSMCYVLNALQCTLINPMIFVLFGVGRARRDAPSDGTRSASNAEIITSVLRGLTKNFIICSLVLGLAYNALFGGMRGATLPFFLDDVCTLLASAFGPMVQFMAGAANVGSFEQLAQLDSALMPLLTVLLKSLLLPTLVMSLISVLGGSRATMDFGFAFNCLPTAGSTLVFARPYRPSASLESLLSSGLALGKLVGFPLLFLAAAIFKTKSVHDVLALESDVRTREYGAQSPTPRSPTPRSPTPRSPTVSTATISGHKQPWENAFLLDIPPRAYCPSACTVAAVHTVTALLLCRLRRSPSPRNASPRRCCCRCYSRSCGSSDGQNHRCVSSSSWSALPLGTISSACADWS